MIALRKSCLPAVVIVAGESCPPHSTKQRFPRRSADIGVAIREEQGAGVTSPGLDQGAQRGQDQLGHVRRGGIND